MVLFLNILLSNALNLFFIFTKFNIICSTCSNIKQKTTTPTVISVFKIFPVWKKANCCDTLSQPDGGAVCTSDHRSSALIRKHTVHKWNIQEQPRLFHLQFHQTELVIQSEIVWGIKPLQTLILNRLQNLKWWSLWQSERLWERS